MEVLNDYPSEIEIGTSIDSFQKAMDSQKKLFHSQIDELRNIVVTQCKLTGVNPLSQEMAAGALSINIGKRPRDLLNPKALKYMQAIFSIKDAINKKESREIGLLYGLTATQVKEYFAAQRSRVRKMVRLSREKAIRASTTNKECAINDSNLATPVDPTPLNSIAPLNADETPSCSNQDEQVLPGLTESETHFVETIFTSMCKEETFSGQVKLMEWILQIENPSVLFWFMNKGGVMILATWLSQAANEEQTSVIAIVLKVLCHLPLNKAQPGHMSAILQGVNKLRFYRIPDISSRARVLLSKWSKMLLKSQALKKPNGTRATGASQQDIELTRRIGELVGGDSWQTSVDNPDNMSVTNGDPDDTRKSETLEPVKLLTTSDESNKKPMLGPSASHNKARRKVQLVEQPGQKAATKNSPVKPIVSSNQRRPITADEIQKAKLRAQYLQSNKTKTEGSKKPSLPTNDLLSASEAYLRPKLEAQKKARLIPPKISKPFDCLSDQKRGFDQKESLLDKCRRVQIPWRVPPEIELRIQIGVGESSKELEIQRNRIHREKETIYSTLQEIPPDPREPWDIEIDYDDTLTPEIPIEQLPDPDDTDHNPDPDPYPDPLANAHVPEIQIPPVPPSDPSTSSSSQAEPDLELLAVLLKNPDLVFALTSGQASGLSNEDTMRLLDMLKKSGGGIASVEKSEEVKVQVSLPSPTPIRNVEVSLPSPTPPSRFEVSLPSPTPSTNPGPSGWTATQAPKNPFSRQTMGVQDIKPVIPITTTVITSDRLQNNTYTLQTPFQSSTPSVIPSLQNQISVPMSLQNQNQNQNQSKYYSVGTTQNPPTLSSSVSSYNRQTLELSRPQLQRYPIPEESSNMGMVNSRHNLPHNMTYTSQVSQNVFNPPMKVGQPGPTRERISGYHLNGRKGYESWSPENSPGLGPGPGSYQPDHRHGLGPGHGTGWSHPDQRGRGYEPPPPDRQGRPYNWHRGGGGGLDRRWNGGDRRR